MSAFSYDGSAICFFEARIKAVQALLRANITTLNTALARDPFTSDSLSIATTDIMRGEVARLDESRSVQIEVFGGGFNPSLQSSVEFRFPDNQATPTSYMQTVHTTIRIWFNPNKMSITATTMSALIAQSEKREDLEQRITDWLRNGVFQTVGGTTMTLTSAENGSADKYDNVKMDSVVAGAMEKQFGGTTMVFCIQVNLSGVNN